MQNTTVLCYFCLDAWLNHAEPTIQELWDCIIGLVVGSAVFGWQVWEFQPVAFVAENVRVDDVSFFLN